MNTQSRKKYSIYQSQRLWLVASTFFVSTGLAVIDQSKHGQAAADQVLHQQNASNQGKASAGSGAETATNQADSNNLAVQNSQADQSSQAAVNLQADGGPMAHQVQPDLAADQAGSTSATTRQPMSESNSTTSAITESKDQAKGGSPSDQPSPVQTVKVGSDSLTRTTGDQVKAEDIANLPLPSLYEQTSVAYESLVKKLGTAGVSLDSTGSAELTTDQSHIAKAGKMIFGQPDKGFAGLTGTKNDYSNVSQMRLTVDDALSKQILDAVKEKFGADTNGTQTRYYPDSNLLSIGGAIPLTASIDSSNHSVLNPLYYYQAFKATLASIANLLSVGLIEDKLSANYQQGQYGVYMRVNVPHGVDPNDFVQALNVDQAQFAAEMNFNANLGMNRLIDQIPGLSTLLSKGLGIPVSGNLGAVVDAVLGKTIDQLNEKYGTNLSARNTDNPFYPISLHPTDTKIDLQEDPDGMYFLVRGDNLSKYTDSITQAKILLTHFMMESLSWAGNIAGGAYGYFNFDLDRYPGNMSTAELTDTYNSDGKHGDYVAKMAPYADNSPYKILTRHQLPPERQGHVALGINVLDANDMLSRQSRDYGHQGDLGQSIAINHDKKHDHRLEQSNVPTWRAYISPFDQENQLNTKSIENQSEEWAEVSGQKAVLPGADLDHRMVVLADGQNFYDQINRFDRVIDYFDHDVLLNGQGFTVNGTVKDIKVVKSTDPDGQLTTKENFAIYNRPFTVYYTGQLTLADGTVTPLRPSQIKVIQKRSADASPLDQERTKAFDVVEEQAKAVQAVIKVLEPKLADSEAEDFNHQLNRLVAQTNQQLEQATDSSGINTIQSQALTDLAGVQDQACRGRDLSRAMLRATKERGYRLIQDQALAVNIAINNATELRPVEKTNLHRQVDQIANDGCQRLGRAKTVAAARNIISTTIQALHQLFLSQSQREEAKAQVAEVGANKKQSFTKIEWVDPTSLQAQQAAVDKIVAKASRSIDAVKTSEELSGLVAGAIQSINRVDDPVVQVAYRPATDQDKANAKAEILDYGQARKMAMTEIAHVDPASLDHQVVLVTQAVTAGQAQVDQATIKADIDQALKAALTAIDQVDQPTLLADYQTVTDADRQAAIEKINQAGQDQINAFQQIDHVDPTSLQVQTALVNQAVTQARLAIQEAQIKVDLQNAVTQGLTAISQISQPTLEPAYQAINSTDRAQAIQQLKTVAEQKQAEFRQIIGVEPQSLTDQLAAVDQALAQALVGVNQAQINKDLQNAIQTGKQLINQVAEPTIRAELQPATSEEKAQAKEILALAVKSRAKAFAEIAHVDPESLQTQLLSLNQSETTGQSKIDQAATKGDLMQAMQGALTLVNQVAEPIIQADYQSVTLLDRFAVNQDLLRAANAKMTIFEQINHVDFQSLTQQKLAINQALSLGQQLVNQAQIRLDLNQAHQKGLAAIEAVAQPSILRAYQPATEAEKAAGRNALARAVDQQKVNFAAIAHVDNQSLATQNQQLDLALQSSQGAIDQAQTKGDLDQAIQTGLAKIQQVPAPTIEDDYQPVTVIDREVAQQEITEAAANRKADFAGIAHVDPQSLTEQVGKIDQFVHAGEFAIAQAQTRGALRAAVSQALHQIDQVSEPVLEQPYRSVSMADRRRAVDQVQGAAEMQKAINGRIAHVDQESLAQKNQMVDDAVLQGMRAIRFARNQGELALAVTEAEQEIDQVGLPLAEYPYRFVTPADLYAAVQFLHQAATEKKAELARVVQADLHSLAEKQSTVDLARVFAEDAMGSAKINQDLMDELNKGINAINAVGNPEIFESFRSATDDDRNRAVSQVHSYVEERKQAFRALDHVNQLSLAAQEKQLDQILTQAQQAIEKAQTKGDVGREVFTAYQAVLAVTQPEIETTYQKPDQSNKDSAIAVVTKMADDKKNDFAKIAHVDPASLVRQNAAISRLLDDLVAAIKKAQTKGDLLQTLVKGLRDLNKIQSPTLQNQYQPATDQARTAAGEKLNQSGQAQIDAWKKLVHVDPLSFGQQSDLVKQVISDGQTTIAKSQTNGDLDRALADALAKLKKISQPDLMIDYQPATDQGRTVAGQKLSRSGQAQIDAWKKLGNLDPISLGRQSDLVNQTVKAGQTAIAQAKTNGDVDRALIAALNQLKKIAQPDLITAAQPATEANRAVASTKLGQAGQDRINGWTKVDHLDPISLGHQNDLVNQAVNQGQAAIKQAQTKGTVDKALIKALADLAKIAQPDLSFDYQPATEASKQGVRQRLTDLVADRRSQFSQIAHVDLASLTIQVNLLDQALHTGLGQVDGARTNGDLTQVEVQATAAINAVQEPTLLADFQPASSAQKNQAQVVLTKQADLQNEKYAAVYGVNQASLGYHQGEVALTLAKNKIAINQAQTVGDLSDRLGTSLDQLDNVGIPDVDKAHQPASADEIAKGEAKIAEVVAAKNQKIQAVRGANPREVEQAQEQVAEIQASGLADLDEVSINGDIDEVVANTTVAIQAVSDPETPWIYQVPSPAERAQAKTRLSQGAMAKKVNLAAVIGHDSQSLEIQEAQVDQIMQKTMTAIDQAPTHLDLVFVTTDGLNEINAVGAPDLMRSFQSVDQKVIDQAKEEIQKAGDDAKKKFGQIPGVNSDSLAQQMKAIDAIVQKIKNLIDQARTQGDVDQAVKIGHEDLDKVPVPNTNPTPIPGHDDQPTPKKDTNNGGEDSQRPGSTPGKVNPGTSTNQDQGQVGVPVATESISAQPELEQDGLSMENDTNQNQNQTQNSVLPQTSRVMKTIFQWALAAAIVIWSALTIVFKRIEKKRKNQKEED